MLERKQEMDGRRQRKKYRETGGQVGPQVCDEGRRKRISLEEDPKREVPWGGQDDRGSQHLRGEPGKICDSLGHGLAARASLCSNPPANGG